MSAVQSVASASKKRRLRAILRSILRAACGKKDLPGKGASKRPGTAARVGGVAGRLMDRPARERGFATRADLLSIWLVAS